MSLKTRTYGILGIGAAIAIGLTYISLKPEPVLVDLHQIASGPLAVTINADGVTRITDIFEVASPITGTALRSPVHIGDVVAGGETVVSVVKPVAAGLLDSRTQAQAEATIQEATAALHVAQTELTRAENDRALAKTQFERTQTLVERDVASLSRLEDAAQRLALGDAAVEAAFARIDMAEGNLMRANAALRQPDIAVSGDGGCCIELIAPADGTVLLVANESERPVMVGAPLVTIGDPTRLELVADLLSSDAVRLTPGATATLDRWGGETLLTATLERIAPSARTKVSALGISEQRVDAIFEITTPLSERGNLGDGFSVYVRISEWENDDVITVPLSALFKRGDDWAVFKVAEDFAEEVAVTIGVQNDQSAQVLSGLSIGDKVITHPNDSISDGQLVALRVSQ